MTTRCRASGPGARLLERRAAAVVGAVQVRRDEIVEPVRLRITAVRAAEPAAGDERVDRPELARPRRRTPSRPCRGRGCRTRRRGSAASIVAATASSLPASRASSVTDAPSRPSRRAIARPIPVPAPVTTMCFPVISAPDVRNLREGRSRSALDPGATGSIDSSLRRVRDARGRSLAGRLYAEAEGQPARWTKAARLGECTPRFFLEHAAQVANSCARSTKTIAICGDSRSHAHLTSSRHRPLGW